MDSHTHSDSDLQRIYAQRFSASLEYRRSIWRILVQDFFQKLVPEKSTVLDLGCGYGEFINQVAASKKFGMDLNPDSRKFLAPEVELLAQDCSAKWPLPDASLDVVFTSNFFEHLPDKAALGRTLDEIRRCLRRDGGRLIAMGPNIKRAHGAYWDFWDHYLPLTELSLKEALENRAFRMEKKPTLGCPLPGTSSGSNSSWWPEHEQTLPLHLPICLARKILLPRRLSENHSLIP
jgi:SAM-dependent methyltransferase